MITPTDYRYFKEHTWVKTLNSTEALVGITDFAQSELGEILLFDLPPIGKSFRQDEQFGIVSGEKESSPLYMPVKGNVLAFNEKVKTNPELVDSDPFGDGWIVLVQVLQPEETSSLLSAAEYDEYVNYLNRVIE